MATSRDERLLGSEFRKIHPKLRMVAKARDDVNKRRSEHCSAMAISEKHDGQESRQEELAPRIAGKVAQKELKTPKMQDISNTVEVNTFVTYFDEDGGGARRLSSQRIKLSDLKAMTDQEAVAFVEMGEPLSYPDAQTSTTEPRAPSATLRNIPGRDSGGRDVLIGIIDVAGYDFSHIDFLTGSTETQETRWIRIWDQGEGGLRPAPDGFGYGSEIRQEHMNAALQSGVELPAWALEPQSQMSVGSHGTHVASIAAGNRGICRNAPIAGVLVDLPPDFAADRRNSFYDSTRVAEAVSYLYRLGEQMGLPVSINISLGTNGGAHDASNAASRWIDHELATPGRAVCVAAGNSGQEKSTEPGDTGFIMGRYCQVVGGRL